MRRSIAGLVSLCAAVSLGLAALVFESRAVAQSSDRAVLSEGEAFVTGFSGAAAKPAPVGQAAVAYIDLAGPSARVIDLRNVGGAPRAQVLAAAKPFTVTAAQVGQVFAVALDRARPPNIYLAASSAYGLPIVATATDAGATPERLAKGAAGAAFMPGLFGPAAMQGGPGSIWRVDGGSGMASLFANVRLEGVANPGAALGGLAFDPASNSLFVADRATGMIHRFGLNGDEIARFDHGVDGRKASGLRPVGFDPAVRLDVASPRFDSRDPATWGYAPPERRVFGLAIRGARLYYAVADGLSIWSVAFQRDGGFGSDARTELQVPPGEAPSEIAKIVFDDRGRMILAERGAPTGASDFLTLSQASAGRVLRYRLLQLDGGLAAATWQAEPDEYATGFAVALRNADGGAAIGFGYAPDGTLDRSACGGSLWTTGEQLRAAADPAFAAELATSGPLPLNGLQGNGIDAVRPENVPPLLSYFANYFDDSGNPAFHGHLGDIAIPRACGPIPLSPTPATLINGWLESSACPPDFRSFDGLCQAPRCPAGHGAGVKCCARGTAPGANGECEPLRAGNLGCPVGAVSLRQPSGSVACAWLARCPDGAQAGTHGGCEHVCPSGETAWPSRKCCGYGEVGLLDGQCCPVRDVREGKCLEACPGGEIRLSDAKCCPLQDAHDGKCVKACPNGQIRSPDGQCAPACGRGQHLEQGHCAIDCPTGETPGPDNLCHGTSGKDICAPGLTPVDGACVDRRAPTPCGRGEVKGADGLCVTKARPRRERHPSAPHEPHDESNPPAPVHHSDHD